MFFFNFFTDYKTDNDGDVIMKNTIQYDEDGDIIMN